MPGRAARKNEQRLSSKQQQIARKVLQAAFDPSGEISQWSEHEKLQLVHAINAAFDGIGAPPLYSVRKLEDWISNAKYRATCKQRKAHPSCWTVQSRTKARAKARETKRQQHRQQATRTARLAPPSGQHQVEHLRLVHERHMTEHDAVRPDFSWADGPGSDDGLAAARGRSGSFASIRAQFEHDGFGRTDADACHRGPLAATSLPFGIAEPVTFAADNTVRPMQTGTSGTTEDSKLIPTFMTFSGVPLPRSEHGAGAVRGAFDVVKADDSVGLPLEEADEMMEEQDAPESFAYLPSGCFWQPSTDISALEAAMSPRHVHLASSDSGGSSSSSMERSVSSSSADEMGEAEHDVQQQYHPQSHQLPVPSGPEWDLFLERNLDALPAFDSSSHGGHGDQGPSWLSMSHEAGQVC